MEKEVCNMGRFVRKIIKQKVKSGFTLKKERNKKRKYLMSNKMPL